MRRVARALRRAFGHSPVRAVGYRGYGTAERVLVLGRVLRHPTIAPPDAAHSSWRNFVDALRRIESDPLPHARVLARLGAADPAGGAAHEVRADDEGFVHAWVALGASGAPGAGGHAPPTPLTPGAWHPVHLALPDLPDDDAADATALASATAHVLVPAPSAAFGVVSDLDDTVLQSEVSSFLRAARIVLLENARTRLPFPGVAAFYRALAAGRAGDAAAAERGAGNPLFYVSSSPWNLYDVIADFLEAQRIPAGPLLLRDWDFGFGLARHGGHKDARIREVLDTYPALPFIFIGDSTQEDPEIYGALARAYPGRVLAIYIRDVTRHPERKASIQALAADVQAAGSTLVLADDTLAIAQHAAARGWIDAAALDAIAADSSADKGAGAEAGVGTSAAPVEVKADAPGLAPTGETPTLVVDEALGRRDVG